MPASSRNPSRRTRCYDPAVLESLIAPRQSAPDEVDLNESRIDWANCLRDCCEQILGGVNLLDIANRSVAGLSAQKIIETLPEHDRVDRSSIPRLVAKAVRHIRRHGLIGTMLPWIEQCGGCVVSMRNCQPLALNSDRYLFVNLADRVSYRQQPDESQLLRYLSRRRQSRLLDLAQSFDNPVEPFFACWFDGPSGKWLIDSPVAIGDLMNANDWIAESTIFHIATGVQIGP